MDIKNCNFYRKNITKCPGFRGCEVKSFVCVLAFVLFAVGCFNRNTSSEQDSEATSAGDNLQLTSSYPGFSDVIVKGKPVVENSTVYWSDADYVLRASDAMTGEEVWQVSNDVGFYMPIFVGKNLYVADRRGTLHRVSKDRGKLEEEIDPYEGADSFLMASYHLGNSHYYANFISDITSYDLNTKKITWQFSYKNIEYPEFREDIISFYVDGDTVYIVTDTSVFGASSNSGSIIWHYATSPEVFESDGVSGSAEGLDVHPPSFMSRFTSTFAKGGDIIYVLDSIGQLYALNASDGNLLWKESVGDRAYSIEPNQDGSVLYVGIEESLGEYSVLALDSENASLIWKFSNEMDPASTPRVTALLSEGDVLYAIGMNSLLSIETKSGDLLDSFSDSDIGWIHTTPILSHDHLYFVNNSGTLYSLKTDMTLLWKIP